MPNPDQVIPYMPYPLYDSHFHFLHMEKKGLRGIELLGGLFSENLAGALDVAVSEDEFIKRTEMSGLFQNLRLSAGIHPSSSGGGIENWEVRFEKIVQQIRHKSVVAVGETGLDFYRDFVPAPVQETAFRDHLNLASLTGLPVIVHNRDADARVLEMIKESACRHGVFHCFSSTWETAKAALELGFHISFAGNVTYKNTSDIRDAAFRVPSDRILLETDAPFLSPQQVRGKPNHPGNLGYILEVLAETRKTTPENLAAVTTANAEKLFAL